MIKHNEIIFRFIHLCKGMDVDFGRTVTDRGKRRVARYRPLSLNRRFQWLFPYPITNSKELRIILNSTR